MPRDFFASPPNQNEINRFGLDIEKDLLGDYANKSPSELVTFLKNNGLSDDEVEYTFLKNFGTTTYNIPTDTTVSALKPISPQAIRKRGVAKAQGYEQIFFSPEERAKKGIAYVPAEPPPQPVQPPAPATVATQEDLDKTLSTFGFKPQQYGKLTLQQPEVDESKLTPYPTREDWEDASGSEEKQSLLQEQARKADQERGITTGPRPEFTLGQLARPIGFTAGALAEAGRLGFVELPAQIAAPIVRAIGGPEKQNVTPSSLISKTEEDLGLEEGTLKPASIEAMKQFASNVEEQMPKTIVDSAAEEGADIIGGLATMLFRDVLPLMPGPERTFGEHLKSSFKSGESFTAGFPVMWTFGVAVGNQLIRGNFREAAQMASAKPITLALVLLPMVKKGAIKVSPAERAWIERTAGKYYAAKEGRGGFAPEPMQPEARATAEAKAASQRTTTDPTVQATPAETAQVETAIAEAKAKQASVGKALQEAAQQSETSEARDVTEFEPTSRIPVEQGKPQFGVTSTQLETAVRSKLPAGLYRDVVENRRFDAQAADRNIPLEDLQQNLQQQVPSDIYREATRRQGPNFEGDNLAQQEFTRLENTPDMQEAIRQYSLVDNQLTAAKKQPLFNPERLAELQRVRDELARRLDTAYAINRTLAQKFSLLQNVKDVLGFARDAVFEQEPPAVGEAAQSVRQARGIPGEKAQVESYGRPTGEAPPDLITRQARPRQTIVYDSKSNTARVRPTAGTVGPESTITDTGLQLFIDENLQQIERLTSKRPEAWTPDDFSLVEKLRQRFVDEGIAFEGEDPTAIARDIRQIAAISKARRAGYLTESFRLPEGELITDIVNNLRSKLIDELGTKQVREGIGKDISLDTAVADQITAVAFDVLAESESTLLNSPKVQLQLIRTLIDEYGVSKKAAAKIVERVVLENKKGIRTPWTEVNIDGTVLEAGEFEGAVRKAFETVVEKDPKAKAVIMEQVKAGAQSSLERFVFNETLRQNAINNTLVIEPTEAGLLDFQTKVMEQTRARGFVDPVVKLGKDGRIVFEDTVNKLMESGDAKARLAGETLARYETPDPALVEAGIVPKDALVSRGFNESMTAVAKLPKAFQAVDQLFGNYKKNLTSRNLLSGMNNFMSNIILETMYYGDPTVVLEAFNPASKLNRAFRRFREGKPATPQEAAAFEAMKKTGIIDTSMIDVEMGMIDEAGILTKGAEKVPVVGKAAGKLLRAIDATQDKFYRFGDNIFKFRTVLAEMENAQGYLDQLPQGKSLIIESGQGVPIEIVKMGDNSYGLMDFKSRTVSALSEQQLNDILARAGSRIAGNKFVDYTKRPRYLDKLEEMRYGPLGGPLVTPFLTWQYKMMDAAVPDIQVGGKVRPGAMRPTPGTVGFSYKPGVVGAFADRVVIGSTDGAVQRSIVGDRISQLARKAGIYGGAENISRDEEPMVARGMSYSGRKRDPIDTYRNQADPRIVYGKNFAQLNFFNPTLSAIGAVESIFTEGVAGTVGDSYLPKNYRDRRAKGETMDAADIADLAGYGGSSLYDMYKRIDDAAANGATSVIPELVKQGSSAILGGTYGRLTNKALDNTIFNAKQRSAGRVPSDPAALESGFATLVRETLGLGYKEAFLYGSLRSQHPAEYLDKAYKQYEKELYNHLIADFTKELTLAKEQGASDAQIDEIRTKHAMAVETYKRISREIANNYKEIVHKAR